MLRSTERQRGTAMTETILALPFLLIILLFITYFGRQSVNVERTHMMSRYQAWRSSAQGPGPRPHVNGSHQQMADTWFNNNSGSLSFDGHNAFPNGAAQRWQDAAARRSDDAGMLLDDMLDALPRGTTANVSSRHETTNKITEVFTGNVQAAHTVLDNDWKYVNGYRHRADQYDTRDRGSMTHNLHSLRDLFYEGFDSTLESMSDAQNPLASTIRSLYLDLGGYRGPKVP